MRGVGLPARGPGARGVQGLGHEVCERGACLAGTGAGRAKWSFGMGVGDGGGWMADRVVGETQTMREKGEVWRLRVI